MKEYIQMLSTELKSTQLIIKILQDKLKSNVIEPATIESLPRRVTINPQVNKNSESESGWIEFRRNTLKTKQPKNTPRCLKQLTPYIPLNVNRFAPLSNLQEEMHQPTSVQSKPQPAKLSKTNGKNQRKVILLGDSHIRGCSEKLADLLGKSYSVIGVAKPNAHVRAITNSINLKTEKLTKKDIVILCGGTRDIAKNEANIGLRHISQFANSTADTNVIVTCAPTCLTCSPHLVSTRKLIPSTENYRNQ